jgi:signal transduction histidine kinase
VILRARDEAEDLLVEVLDQGPGIPAEEQPLIFEDFFRGRDAGQVSGSGLGLSIAKKIVEAHHGAIWVESPYPGTGSGAKFTVTIPRNLATPSMRRRDWATPQEAA